MTSPVLFVVDDDAGSLGTLDGTLRRRYERDYLVIAESSFEAALGRLRELRAADNPVAVVMAKSAMSAAPAAEFLAHARTIAPAAAGVVGGPRGAPAAPSLRVPVPLVADRQAAAPVLRAIAHGIIDAYLPAPTSCATCWPATACPMSSTPPSRRTASCGCSGPGRMAQRCRS